MVLPIGFLAILTLFVGFAIGPVFNIALRAGVQLANPAQYIAAVFGGT
jgi:hypothetical protein